MMCGRFEYESTRRVVYGDDGDECGRATFVPVCEKCGRFVKADPMLEFNEYTISDDPNATCSKCGRTHMVFEGFI